MKHLLLGAALATLVGSAMAANVGVSVSIGEPGFYGRIDLGHAPQPQLIFAQPVIIQQGQIGYARQPIYLRVPPGHEKNWNKHCRQYNACGQPVYFVQDNWYRNQYAPAYRGDRGDHADRGDRRGQRDQRDEERGNNDHGNGRGHDKENKRGRGND